MCNIMEHTNIHFPVVPERREQRMVKAFKDIMEKTANPLGKKSTHRRLPWSLKYYESRAPAQPAHHSQKTGSSDIIWKSLGEK